MSAYVVDKETIDRIVTYIHRQHIDIDIICSYYPEMAEAYKRRLQQTRPKDADNEQ